MSRYLPLLDTLKARLAEIAPNRLVTRKYDDFANREQSSEMAGGVYQILAGGVRSYDYETSDQQDASSSLRATAASRFRFVVIGQQWLGDHADGEAVEAAEFQMVAELEQLADEALELDGLHGLLLKRCDTSTQRETPFAWVVSEWEVFPVND